MIIISSHLVHKLESQKKIGLIKPRLRVVLKNQTWDSSYCYLFCFTKVCIFKPCTKVWLNLGLKSFVIRAIMSFLQTQNKKFGIKHYTTICDALQNKTNAKNTVWLFLTWKKYWKKSISRIWTNKQKILI